MPLSFTVTNCYSIPSVVCDPYSTITTHLMIMIKLTLVSVYSKCSSIAVHIFTIFPVWSTVSKLREIV